MDGAKPALVGVVLLIGGLGLSPTGAIPQPPAPALDDWVADDLVVVLFEERIPATVELALAGLGWIVERGEPLSFVVVQTDPALAPLVIDAMLARDDVAHAYNAGIVRTMLTPNDPLYGSQWGPPVIGMPAAWDSGLGSHAIKVAVLDTGSDSDHADLAPNLAGGDASCGPDANLVSVGASPEDDHGHGTHVAGTVAALTNNAVGVAGMSQACIMTVKVLNSGGSGFWHQVALGIVHAATNGANIVSMSLGGLLPDPTVLAAVESAYASGVLVIAAAGNSGCGTNTVIYPAGFPDAMAVSSLASATTLSGFSSCGPAVEIAAPGSSILSTCFGGGYCTKSGTSMATPHVSGVAALVWSHNTGLTNAQVRCILQKTADDIGAAGRDDQFGYGRLDAASAVAAAVNPASVGCQDPLPIGGGV